MITPRHTTLGRTPLNEGSALRRDLYLTTHNTHNNKHPYPRRDSSTQSQQASDPRPRGHWDRRFYQLIHAYFSSIRTTYTPSPPYSFGHLVTISDGYKSYRHAVIFSMLILPSRSRSKNIPHHIVLKHPKPMSLLFTNSYMRHGAYSIKIINQCYSLNATENISRPYTRKKVVVLNKIEEAKAHSGL